MDQETTIPQVSKMMQKSILKELEKLPSDMDSNLALLEAVRVIAEKYQEEQFKPLEEREDLLDSNNKGDLFLLSLAKLD